MHNLDDLAVLLTVSCNVFVLSAITADACCCLVFYGENIHAKGVNSTGREADTTTWLTLVRVPPKKCRPSNCIYVGH